MKPNKNLKNIITTRNIFKLILLIALICLSLWGISRLWFLHQYITINKHNPNEHLFDFWNMFWTFISALSIPFSVISYLTTKNIESSNKLREQKRDLIEGEIPKFWSEYNTHYNNLNESSLPIITERKELSPETNDLVQHGICILLKINNIKKNSRDTNDVDDYSGLITEFLSNYKDVITADFPILSVFFEPYDTIDTNRNTDSYIDQDSNISSTKDSINPYDNVLTFLIGSDPSNVLFVRTLDTYGSIERIVGDWKMSSSRAKNIKYIIGVTGNAYGTKTYLKTVKVSGFNTVGDRIRFKYENILLDNTTESNDAHTAEMSKYVSELVSNWKAINPIVYLSHLGYLFSQQIIYQTFEDEFSQKINEYNTIKKDSGCTKLQIFKEFSELRTNGFFRIRFRSNKLDSALSVSDKSGEREQHLAYNDYSHWYEIISDNNLKTINFSSVFFTHMATDNNGDAKQFFDNKQLNEFYDYKQTEKVVTPFVANDKKKIGYIITIDELSKSEINNQESLTHFFTNVFNEIDKDLEFVKHNTK
ncbi:hypothetical protein FGL74_03980 [Leuconostoc koreense]|nr:hypothetical protein FGL74_03980 [Leuconostoc mesenteroides]QGM24819.1 hypothetical protein GJV51_01960 [Leuconostoc mesenteroides subsp. mesenteroides]